eukprot:TRINITY_DN996_c0_g2_i1.p1 TRINITY_DN996_c0_g2~~TRINITY_DN996_c0_g2_i1.p1  ORF type:complete len:131 (-),score=29.53 TRINITY_DN996_c0_g2_i1:178-570(-)
MKNTIVVPQTEKKLNVLLVNKGFINAVAVAELRVAVSHVTGHLTMVGIELERGKWFDFVYTIGILTCFFLGAMTSGIIIGQSKFKAIYPYGQMLILESLLLIGSAISFAFGTFFFLFCFFFCFPCSFVPS